MMSSPRLSSSRPFAIALFVLAGGVSSAFAANIAPLGFPIIGVNTALDSTTGTPLEHAGSALNINDQNFNTSVDTFNAPNPETFSYVGVLFPSPRTDLIQTLTLSIAAFFDGGWFGPNNLGPGASGTLNSSHLLAPTVQVTTNGGSTWTNVGATSNYVSQLTGTMLPVAFGPATHAAPATFTLTTPQTLIDGIRLIGLEGGTASGGFIGVFELEVDAVPEPSAALALLGGAGFLGLLRRRA